MIGGVFYQLQVTLHLLPIRGGSAPERSPVMGAMRRVMYRGSVREHGRSALCAMIEDIELTTALGEEDV